MTKRESRAIGTVIVWLLLIGLAIEGVEWITASIPDGAVEALVAMVVGIVGLLVASTVLAPVSKWTARRRAKALAAERARQRHEYLVDKYKDEELAQRLVLGEIWQNQTAEQVMDARGAPLDREEKVLKTKKKEVWKYDREGRGRYRLRVILENDLVVGWERR